MSNRTANEPSSGAVSLAVDADGVALLTLDVPGEPVNTLYSELKEEFSAAMERVETDASIRAAVLASGKKDNFIAGARIEELQALRTPEDARARALATQGLLARLAASKKPVVAAIHGACLGGGLETALACQYRIATEAKKTVLGLPEVRLGLLPGAGGTQRLPRLTGIAAALDLILTGKHVQAAEAKKLGFVDEVVTPAILLEVATKRARQIADGELDPARQREKKVSLRQPKALRERLRRLALEQNPAGRRLLFRQARAKLLADTHGHYPAPERALDAVREGAEHGLVAGLEAEAEAFGELAMTDVSHRLVELFFATRELKKDNGTDDSAVRPLKVEKLGVVGAGLMGSGIAFVGASVAGFEVRLRDRDDVSLGRGMRAVQALFDARVKEKRLARRDRDQKLARVTGGTDYSGFGRVDLAIEAVFEDLALKHRVIAELEACLPERAVIASITSSLSIAEVAQGAKRPERVVGMHFFSPVEKMPLVEVVTHAKAAPEAVATAVAAAKAQGKTVIVARDGVGFYASRILAPYLNETAYLLQEGARIDALDEALVRFGFPVGPISLLDEVGLDVAARVGPILEAELGERMKPAAGLEAFVRAGRLGRKAKKGFYLYDERGVSKKKRGKKVVDPAAYEALPTGARRERPSADEMAERLVLAMVNEAVRCLSDGVLRSPRDGDIGAILGLGFPPFRGGPFRYVDACGATAVVDRLRRLEERHGIRFAPAPLLTEHAREGKRFY